MFHIRSYWRDGRVLWAVVAVHEHAVSVSQTEDRSLATALTRADADRVVNCLAMSEFLISTQRTTDIVGVGA